MNNHTPGPWYGKNTSGGQGLVIEESTGKTVAVVYDLRDTALIAAAPELLVVLNDFVNYVIPGDDVPLAAMLDEARAAIAKVAQS